MKKSAIYLAVANGIFTLIACAMLPNFNAMFFVAYLFGVLAILTGWYTLRLSFKHGKDAKSQFYGFPILRVGLVYAAIQLLASLLCMIFAKYLPLAVMLPVFFVLFCVAAVGLASTAVTRDEIRRQDTALKKQVGKMRTLQSMGNSLIAQCEDPEVAREVKKLAEALHYSDPVSCEALESVENELTNCMDELQRAILENDKSGSIGICKKTIAVLTERNRLCKLNK